MAASQECGFRFRLKPDTVTVSVIPVEVIMKRKIIARRVENNLYFYLKSKHSTQYLFMQRYTRAVYDYFRYGISENQLRTYKGWDRNPRMDKTVEKLPLYITYVLRECA